MSDEQIMHDTELTLVMLTASVLAGDKKDSITLSRLFAAIYISFYDQLQVYCDDWKGVVRFIRYECSMENPPWIYWVRIHEVLISGKSYGVFTMEPEVDNLIRLASEKATTSGRQRVSVLDVLQAISEQHHVELCQKFIAAGINLEQATKGQY